VIKRLFMISALVTAFVIMILLCACAEKEEPLIPDGSVPVGSSPSAPPVFDTLDMKGEDFVFLTYNDRITDYSDNYIWSDNTEGGAVELAVIKRNGEVGREFNVIVRADEVESPKNEAMARIKAGQYDFDVIYEWGTRASIMALDGHLLDFYELSGIDLTKTYWAPETTDDLTVDGKMYLATNYVTMNSIGWAECVFFNKNVYEELGYTNSLYDMVKAKKWTFDKYISIALESDTDLDADGRITCHDRFGIFGNSTGLLMRFARSSGVHNTVKNEDGSYSLAMYSPTVIDIFSTYSKALAAEGENVFVDYANVWSSDIYLVGYSGFISKYKSTRAYIFGDGHVMFLNGNIDMTHEFDEMKDEYGILPNPLFSQSQDQYYHFIDANAPMFSIPAGSDSLDTTGIILEYLAYKSEEHLLPAFYDEYVDRGRNSSTDLEMVNIIKATVNYEWTSLYSLTVTDSILTKMMTSGSFSTVFERIHTRAEAEIRGCLESLKLSIN